VTVFIDQLSLSFGPAYYRTLDTLLPPPTFPNRQSVTAQGGVKPAKCDSTLQMRKNALAFAAWRRAPHKDITALPQRAQVLYLDQNPLLT